MKLLLSTAAAILISTFCIADESTRYHDLRLDTSVTAEVIHSAGASTMRPNGRPGDLWLATFPEGDRPAAVLSTSGTSSRMGEGFPYGGYEPGNDSR